MRIGINVNGKEIPVEVQGEPTDADIEEIAASLGHKPAQPQRVALPGGGVGIVGRQGSADAPYQPQPAQQYGPPAPPRQMYGPPSPTAAQRAQMRPSDSSGFLKAIGQMPTPQAAPTKGPSILTPKTKPMIRSVRDVVLDDQAAQDKKPLVKWNGKTWRGDPFEQLPFTMQAFQLSVNDPSQPVVTKSGKAVPFATAAKMVGKKTGVQDFKASQSLGDVEEAQTAKLRPNLPKAQNAPTGLAAKEAYDKANYIDGKRITPAERNIKAMGEVRKGFEEAGVPSLLTDLALMPADFGTDFRRVFDANEPADKRAGAAANVLIGAATSEIGGRLIGQLSKPARAALMESFKASKAGKLILGAKDSGEAINAAMSSLALRRVDAERLVNDSLKDVPGAKFREVVEPAPKAEFRPVAKPEPVKAKAEPPPKATPKVAPKEGPVQQTGPSVVKPEVTSVKPTSETGSAWRVDFGNGKVVDVPQAAALTKAKAISFAKQHLEAVERPLPPRLEGAPHPAGHPKPKAETPSVAPTIPTENPKSPIEQATSEIKPGQLAGTRKDGKIVRVEDLTDAEIGQMADEYLKRVGKGKRDKSQSPEHMAVWNHNLDTLWAERDRRSGKVAEKPAEPPLPVKAGGEARRVNVGGEDHDLTGPAKKAYDEAEARFKAATEREYPDTLTGNAEKEAARKTAAEQFAKAKREIVGALSEKEAKAADLQANKVVAGTRVSTPSGPGVAKANAFGKVTGTLDDGTPFSHPRAEVKPETAPKVGPMEGAAKVESKPIRLDAPEAGPANVARQSGETPVKPVQSPESKPVGYAQQIDNRPAGKGTTPKAEADSGAKYLQDKGDAVVKAAVQKAAKGEAPLRGDEIGASLHRLRGMQNDLEQAEKAAAAGDEATRAALAPEIERLNAGIEEAYKAGDFTGNEWHKTGQALQVALKADYSLQRLQTRAKAHFDAEVPKAVADKIEALSSRIKEQDAALSQARKDFAAQIEKMKADKPRNVPTDRKTSVRNRNVANLRRFLGDEKGAQREAGVGGRNAGVVISKLPDAERNAMQAARQLAREAIEGGAKDTAEVLDHIRKTAGINATDERLLYLLSEPYRNHLLQADIARRQTDAYLRQLQKTALDRRKPVYQRFLSGAGQLYTGLQRPFQAGLDISAPFIQGRKGLFASPGSWVKAWGPMLNALKGGEKAADVIQAQIRAHPLYARAKTAGLEFTEHGGSFTAQEETFAGNLIDTIRNSKVPGAKQYAELIARSDFAFNAFMNRLKMDTFAKMAQADPTNPAYLRDIAGTINTIYGRGASDLAKKVGSIPLAGNTIYAPRYAISGFEYAGFRPLYSAETALGRKAALKVYAAQAAAYGGIVAMARMAGWDVETDPRSTDFGKVFVPAGNGQKLSVDLFAKEGQAYRLFFQVLYGKINQKGDYKPPTLYNSVGVASQFVTGKLSPAAKAVTEPVFGVYDEDAGGQREYEAKDFGLGFTPLWTQSAAKDDKWKLAPLSILADLAGLNSDVAKNRKTGGTDVPLDLLKPGIRAGK